MDMWIVGIAYASHCKWQLKVSVRSLKVTVYKAFISGRTNAPVIEILSQIHSPSEVSS